MWALTASLLHLKYWAVTYPLAGTGKPLDRHRLTQEHRDATRRDRLAAQADLDRADTEKADWAKQLGNFLLDRLPKSCESG